MAGGFLSGLLAGAVLSGAALGALSVVTGGARIPAPGAATIEVPVGSEFNRARVDAPARMPVPDGAPRVGADAPKVGAVAPDDLSAVGPADLEPSVRPMVGGIETDLSAPQVPSEDSGMLASIPDGAAGMDAPAAAAPSFNAPASDASAGSAPDTGGASIFDDPAQPTLPEVETGAGLGAPALAPQAAQPSLDAGAGDGLPATDEPEPGNASADASPRDAQMAQASGQAPRSGIIGNIAKDIETNRLPSVGVAPEKVSRANRPAQTRAIIANAADFDNSGGKPLMAIVLIDEGTSPVMLQALNTFPYPLSFAVDASAPDAAARMTRYRDAGFEVLAIADLPEGADARDTETVMQTVFDAVPEAVGILEGTRGGLQISRAASEQLAPILLERGHGLVLFPKGLETAPKLIAREGVPTGTIFRDIDSQDQSAATIRRVLDQAAFKAARDEGGVILLGRLRADTISALLLWGLQDRASSVALAPVSAVLLGAV